MGGDSDFRKSGPLLFCFFFFFPSEIILFKKISCSIDIAAGTPDLSLITCALYNLCYSLNDSFHT